MWNKIAAWFGGEQSPPSDPNDPLGLGSNTTDCKHLNARVRGNDRMSTAYCSECGRSVYLSDVFNNWLERLRATGLQHKEIEKT